MTGEYTFVTPERQNELTRRIQEKLADASTKKQEKPVKVAPVPPEPSPDVPPTLANLTPATSTVQ
jgi:hypothetical protein